MPKPGDLAVCRITGLDPYDMPTVTDDEPDFAHERVGPGEANGRPFHDRRILRGPKGVAETTLWSDGEYTVFDITPGRHQVAYRANLRGA